MGHWSLPLGVSDPSVTFLREFFLFKVASAARWQCKRPRLPRRRRRIFQRVTARRFNSDSITENSGWRSRSRSRPLGPCLTTVVACTACSCDRDRDREFGLWTGWPGVLAGVTLTLGYLTCKFVAVSLWHSDVAVDSYADPVQVLSTTELLVTCRKLKPNRRPQAWSRPHTYSVQS